MLCGDLDGKAFAREGIHVCVWPSPFPVPLKLSRHCQLAILQYKIKSLMNKNEIKCVSMLGLSHMSRLKLGI